MVGNGHADFGPAFNFMHPLSASKLFGLPRALKKNVMQAIILVIVPYLCIVLILSS